MTFKGVRAKIRVYPKDKGKNIKKDGGAEVTLVDLQGKDVCSELLGGRMSRNGTTVKCYRDGMQVFRGAYRVAGVFFDGECHYWEELEWEGSLVRQLDDLAAEAEIYGIGFVYIGSEIDRSEDEDIIEAVFYEWLKEVDW